MQGGGGSGEQLGGVAGFLLDAMEAAGEVGVGLLNVVDTFFPPIPSEVFLPLAGFLAGQGRLSWWLAWVCATVGSLVGALLLHRLGARLGRDRSTRVLTRVPLLEQRDVERGEAWFDRHGDLAVLLGRFVPGVRSLVSLPAGVEGMPLLRFSLLTVLGSAGWNALLMGAGLWLGQRWRTVSEYSSLINYAVYALVALAVARLVWVRRDRVPFLPS